MGQLSLRARRDSVEPSDVESAWADGQGASPDSRRVGIKTPAHINSRRFGLAVQFLGERDRGSWSGRPNSKEHMKVVTQDSRGRDSHDKRNRRQHGGGDPYAPGNRRPEGCPLVGAPRTSKRCPARWTVASGRCLGFGRIRGADGPVVTKWGCLMRGSRHPSGSFFHLSDEEWAGPSSIPRLLVE